MEWLTQLQSTIVGVDTAPFIYFIERNPTYLSLVLPFFEAVQRGELQAVTSTVTLAEILVHPYRRGDQVLARRYAQILLNAPNLRVVAVSPEIADDAARIRAAQGAKTPDAIQLATARSAQATAFLTNDAGIAATPGLNIIVLDRLLVKKNP